MWVLLKYNNSDNNIRLLKFLLKYKGKVVVVKVFDDMIPKLKSKIDRLPALIKDGNVTVGVDSIINELTPKKKENPYSLETFWDTEMHSGEDNTTDDAMDKAQQKAIQMSINSKSRGPRDTNGVRGPTGPRNKSRSSSKKTVNPDNVSDFTDDPIMKKFWDNQECTPNV